ncbi:MAG: FAD-dependent oxidoreductase [Opitutales bacterium]|nr:FAD-dependent oxidoreductase [Opitutales bacterium]
MNLEKTFSCDVLVAGAGAGGICAALQAARQGARVLLVEKAGQIGGTGVHSPVSLVCKFHGTDHRPINIGIHSELYPEIYPFSTRDHRPTAKRLTYDEKILLERYQKLLAAEVNLTVQTGAAVKSVTREDRRLTSVTLSNGKVVEAECFIDATADGNLAALADCFFLKGRDQDGALQSATLTFAMENIDKSKLRKPEFLTRAGADSLWKELTELYREAKEKGETQNPKSGVVAFPYPDGERLLFNSNEVIGIDPTVPGSVEEARQKALEMVDELVAILRRHPAFAKAEVCFVSPKMGVREGRRIIGEYVLNENDCLGEARFPDMVAACAYEIDIHDPEGGETRMVDIPGSGYYHIPYRSIIARDADNLLLGSRCISGTHEAHSSYRVMSGVTAIGQAAGCAAALASQLKKPNVREVKPEWIRHELRRSAQFVEGPCEAPST